MSKPKTPLPEKSAALPKRLAGHRRSSLAIFFRGEEPQETEDAQVNQRLKPKDQVQLSPEELRQRMPPRILYPQNPRAPQNITRFSFKDSQFKKEGDVEQTVFHLIIESTLLLKESPEAAEQEELLRLREEAAERRKELEAVEVAIEDDGETQDEEGRVMRNQFNNVDRATHIRSRATVERSCSTMPPPKRACCGTANRWIMCDAYVTEAETQNRKECDAKAGGRNPQRLLAHDQARSLMSSDRFRWSLKTLERVVSFNAQQEAYRTYQETEEEPRDIPLALTPIWELRLPRVKGKDAMVFKWNPQYHDLLAVGFGNYEYLKQGNGYVCCFSLKNTSYPEYFWKLDSKVCGLDWHPLQPSLLCVGLYDGNVAVLDATSPSKRPWHSSTVRTGKHIDPVWDVRWEADASTSQLSFFSVSADGRVMRWTLLKNKLEAEGLLALKRDSGALGGADSSSGKGASIVLSLASGLCFDFCPFRPQEFVVGTEDGTIFKCSKDYSGQFLSSYKGHDMPVNTLHWSPFSQHIFLSASADWRVMLWDDRLQKSIVTFDYGTPVNDAAWAPYSATQFAVLTANGMLHVHDLSEHRRLPVLSQKVCADAASARLCFNSKTFVLAVAEMGGTVTIVKLPQKLLTVPTPPEAATLTAGAWQAERLNTVLLLISEEFRAAANPRDLSVRALQELCQGEPSEPPQQPPTDE